MRGLRVALLLGMVGAITSACEAQAVEGTVKDKYHAVQVDKFEIETGVEFPPEYLQSLQDEILKQLQSLKEFKQVLHPDENPTDAAAPVLRLTGKVTHFKTGSRAKRYVIGYGAGSTEIYAHVTFLDRSTGQAVIAQEVRGVMAGGLFGGESLNVTRDFAKKVATSTKLILTARLPAAAEASPVLAANIPPAAVASSAKPDRHIVTVSSKDFDGAEKQLNAEAAAGYRLGSFEATGSKTADMTLEKSATPPDVYQYRLLHVRYLPTLQKELNKSADDGFRLSSHTLAQLGGAVAVVVMEKPPVPLKMRYQYRVHMTMRVSSAARDVEKDQGEGFTLAETAESPFHLVILEKAVERGYEGD
jgi:hypothetical protein